ncbi:MAG: Rpn family recombination-promoting nuclease/putative transposase, partial [Spirochaetes bacterium]|nr:Rpn family recombination-promoting nuclease/putative transposase [Spirochaetota bacterium]
FVKFLDYDSLLKIDKSFITAEFIDREADILYKVNFKNSEIYIFLLIEFQSSPEKFMSQRMLRYIMEFYDYLIREQNVKKLPAVFPVMLYNGERKWSSPVNVRNLIEKTAIPEKYLPFFQYCKIAENEFSDSFIIEIKNFIAAVFFVENNNPEKIKSEIDILIQLLEKEKPELIETFRNWFSHAIKVDKDEIVDKLDNAMEVLPMGFAEKFDRSINNAYIKGIEQGIEKGLLKEKIQTAEKMLIDGVDIRFISRYTGLTMDEIEKMR